MTHLSRRPLLKTAAGLTVTFALPRAARASPGSLAPDAVDAYLAIAPDGVVTLYAGKVDLGTGARAALRQILADELGAAIDRIALIEGDTALCPDQGGTGGSTGIAVGAMQIRHAAATARQKLLSLAAEQLQRDTTELEAIDSQVRPKSHGPGLSFATLLDGQAFSLAVDPGAPLKQPAEFRYIGSSWPRPDLPAKFTARHIYVQDFRLPVMLHGRVIRPPAIGAKLLSVDDTSIAGIPDAKIVRIRNFLGVVAPGEWNAVRAARTLRATWSTPPARPGSDRLVETMRAAKVASTEVLKSIGNPTPVFATAKTTLTATYSWPIQSHASMGPSCAVADIRPDGATIWTASQATHRNQRRFAALLDLPVTSVRLIYLDGSGSYGTNGNDDVAADAALLSRATGLPVRVQWSRQDELGWDPKGPPHLLDMRGALNAKGQVTAWETTARLPANTQGLPGIPLLAVEAAGLAQKPGMSSGLISANADPPYGFPNIRVAIDWLAETPLRPSNLRAPGKIGNVFAVESFTDELAAAVGADPVAFRVGLLSEPRAIAVLRRVADAMAWQTRPSPAPIDPKAAILRGRGIAYVHYKQAENFIAMAMEVAVARATGIVRVERVVCAHDCGLMINPDGVRAQVEGCILQTISRTLFEEVAFDGSRVTSTDWASYPILTFPDVPRLEIHLIDRPHDKPLGAGEAATAPVAAAIGNAVFDAAGIRLRSAPFTRARVKAALHAVAS